MYERRINGMFGMNIDVSAVHTMERAMQDIMVPLCLFCFTVSPFVCVESTILGYMLGDVSKKRLR